MIVIVVSLLEILTYVFLLIRLVIGIHCLIPSEAEPLAYVCVRKIQLFHSCGYP